MTRPTADSPRHASPQTRRAAKWLRGALGVLVCVLFVAVSVASGASTDDQPPAPTGSSNVPPPIPVATPQKDAEAAGSGVANDPGVASLCNSRIGLNIGPDGTFNEGAYPASGCGGNGASWSLSFGWPGSPGTGFATVQIDSANYRVGGGFPTVVSPPTNTDSTTNVGSWQAGAIEVTQRLRIASNPATGQLDAVRVAYTVTNHGSSSHAVGVRLMVDTDVNGNDGNFVNVPGHGDVTTEQSYSGASVPDRFYTLSDLAHIGAATLKGSDTTTPDRLVIARWPGIVATDWDYAPDVSAPITSDSAYAVYWNPTPLAPGSIRTYVTYYGLKNVAALTGRYVAFGDSIPYGHGLADPKKGDPPSDAAYPALVRQGLRGLRPLSYRSSNCGLTGDQLAVSGAPSIANAATAGDGECGDSVFPQEIRAAQLASDQPLLVTIQAGADDIRFSKCLMAVLGVPHQDPCVTGNNPGSFALSTNTYTELQSLDTGLRAAITTIHRQAPNAQILLVNYYQIIPGPDTPLVNETHSDLCGWFQGQSSAKGRSWRVKIKGQADFLQAALNRTIAGAASADVRVVDIASVFRGTEMCTHASTIFDGFSLGGTSTAGHPTAPGHHLIADAILQVCSALPRKCLGR